MNLSIDKIKTCCDVLAKAMTVKIADITDLTACQTYDYKVGNEPPKGEYKPFDALVNSEERYWIKAEFATPDAVDSSDYFLNIKVCDTGWDGLNPQLILYLNGEMAKGFDMYHTTVKLCPNTKYDSVCSFYAGNENEMMKVRYELVRVNRRTEKLYYDLIVPLDACRDVYSENSEEYALTLRALEEAVNILDLRSPGSSEFDESVEAAIEYMDSEFYGKICSTAGKPVVNCIGHSHIDVEWLWDRRQTREKIQRTASTAIGLMEEYPEYKFMLSQPELYRYLREEAPQKYEQVKEKVKEGKWEPEGALYLECDCNLTGGESLVRQLVYGKRFFEKEFGVQSRVCFLPDVFGYSAAMPQILRKSGVDYFVTSKISWNDTNTMPYDAFVWQGIDGSEIFSSFITGQNFVKGGEPQRNTTYVGDITSSFVKGSWERFKQKEYSSVTLNTYGYGDGGGGPTRQMLERARRLAKGLPGIPVANLTTLTEHLDRMKSEFDKNTEKLRRAPKWVGELYLEYHRGTYTSQASTKRGNRKSEVALATAEASSSTAMYFGREYDKNGLDKAWLDLLHNQFHDILPGSSVDKVYEFALEDYARILGYANKEAENALSSIANRLSTKGGVLVYNPTGFDRAGEISLDGKTLHTGVSIPAYGYAVVDPICGSEKVKVNRLTAENDFYRMTIDSAGRIVSLYDKRAERETVAEGEFMNQFVAYEDYPVNFDAWDIDRHTYNKAYPITSDAEITPVTDGVRAGFLVKRKYMSSEIKQTIWLYSDSARIDFDHDIDWHEKHQVLKLCFPVNVHATRAVYDVQFGSVERPTHRNTDWDSAKFEVCAHKWVDISEYGYGVALMNDCKYGHSVEGSKISLTCLKCAEYPAKNADLGKHEFTCSLLPHSGDYREAGVIKEAYFLNRPMLCMPIGEQNGDLPDSFSTVSIDCKAVVIDGIKRAENSCDMIVRLYESFGGKTKAILTLPEKAKSAYLTDLMENEIAPLAISDGKVELDFGAYEIHTVKVEF